MTKHLKHILEITTEPWFREKPWILLGTGPSLDNFDYDKYKDTHNIAAIYCAVDVCDKVDIHFLSDQVAYLELFGRPENRIELSKSYNPDSCRYIATRITNLPGATPNTVYWEYDCDLRYLNGVKIFKEFPTFPCSNTSSFITQFFGAAQIKELFITGFDGGKGATSSKINEGYRAHSVVNNFDVENEGFYGWARQFGIKLTKI